MRICTQGIGFAPRASSAPFVTVTPAGAPRSFRGASLRDRTAYPFPLVSVPKTNGRTPHVAKPIPCVPTGTTLSERGIFRVSLGRSAERTGAICRGYGRRRNFFASLGGRRRGTGAYLVRYVRIPSCRQQSEAKKGRADGPLAQRLEPPAHNRQVPGSNPGGPTFPPFSSRRKRFFRRSSALAPCARSSFTFSVNSGPCSVAALICGEIERFGVLRSFAILTARFRPLRSLARGRLATETFLNSLQNPIFKKAREGNFNG